MVIAHYTDFAIEAGERGGFTSPEVGQKVL
jgi:hypothetical protein